jgi:hypothetical protein
MTFVTPRPLTMSPGFTAAVATVARGVGIITGVFSMLNGIALRDLPAPDADELVSIHRRYDEETRRQRLVGGYASRLLTSECRTYNGADWSGRFPAGAARDARRSDDHPAVRVATPRRKLTSAAGGARIRADAGAASTTRAMSHERPRGRGGGR